MLQVLNIRGEVRETQVIENDIKKKSDIFKLYGILLIDCQRI